MKLFAVKPFREKTGELKLLVGTSWLEEEKTVYPKRGYPAHSKANCTDSRIEACRAQFELTDWDCQTGWLRYLVDSVFPTLEAFP